MSPREFFRLGQYAWGEDEPQSTTNYDEFISLIRSARVVVGANFHQFDLSVLFGVDSIEPVHMARRKQIIDTLTHATLVNPAPPFYFNEDGKKVKSDTPGTARRWFKLQNQAYQLGVEGKTMDLAKYAATFLYDDVPVVSEKTGKTLKRTERVYKEGICCGFGAIPVDDPTFVEYALQDVIAVRNVLRGLIEKFGPIDDYAWREQLKAAIDAQITRNGFRLDQELAFDRVKETAEEAARILNDLHDRYGFPLDGKKPLTSNVGKEALLKALKEVGVKERFLLRTDKGALSFSGDSVKGATAQVGTPEAIELGEAVAILAGQRTLPELALASVFEDGKVHPSILPLQKSGRKSITEPGLTVWNARGPKARQKEYFIPSSEDEALMEFDLSNADARGVAGLSGDKKFALRFEPGQDGHMINAIAAWGAEKVAEDPAKFRDAAKAPGHGWSYLIGAKKLSATTGLSIEESKVFLDNMNEAFPGVVAWQKKSQAFARAYGYVMNDWGRKMPVDKGREFTQPPALEGQSTTNEVMSDGLIKLPDRILRMVVITVHDALVLSMPLATLDRDRDVVLACFTRTWKPKNGGQEIEFPLGYGPAGRNWRECAHG
jgi:DNA polymerase-1